MATRTRAVHQKLEHERGDDGSSDKSLTKTGGPWLKIWKGINYVMVAFLTLAAFVQVSHEFASYMSKNEDNGE